MKIFQFMNPLSSRYHAAADFKSKLSKKQKFLTILAAAFGSILPVIGTTMAFRGAVKHFKKTDLQESPSSSSKTTSASKDHQQLRSRTQSAAKSYFENSTTSPKSSITDSSSTTSPKSSSLDLNSTTKLPVPSTKLLFHIHGDAFGSQSQLQGATPKDNISYLVQFLESRQDANNPNSGKIISQLKNVIHVDSPDFDIQSAIQKIYGSLNQQSPLLISGGWTSPEGGHSIYFEIIPGQGSEASLRLYSLGAGVDFHPSAVRGHKVKYRPVMEWSGIERRHLYSTQFLTILNELMTQKKLPEDPNLVTDYNENDIYESLQELLSPKSVTGALDVVEDDENLMTSHRSGVCAWKSLMAYVATKMEKGNYKRFKCDIKLQSLLDFVIAKNKDVTELEWRLVKKSHANLAQSIIKLKERKLIDDDFAKEAADRLKIVSQWIKTHNPYLENMDHKSIQSEYTPSSISSIIDYPTASLSPTVDIPTKKEILIDGIQPWSPILDRIKDFKLSNPKNIQATLKEVIELGNKSWLAKEDAALQVGLLEVIYQLDLDPAFWEEVIGKDSQIGDDLMIQLGQIAQLFFNSCYTVEQAEVLFPEKNYMMYKTLKLQEIICRKSHPTWEKLSLMDEYNNNCIIFPNTKMHREMSLIRSEASEVRENSFYLSSYQNETYPDYMSVHLDSSESYYLFSKGHKRVTTPRNFQDILVKEFPEVCESIPVFERLPTHDQDALLFASDKLPPWLKALRDTSILHKFIAGGNLGTLKSVDRSQSFTPNFSYMNYAEISALHGGLTEQARIGISLKGINSNLLNVPISWHDCFSFNYRSLHKSGYCNLNWLTSGPVEKELYSKMREAGVTNFEEYASIRRFAVNCKISTIEALEHFTKHPEKLKDFQIQSLFHMILFRLGSGLEETEKARIEKQLLQFIKFNYTHFLDQNNITTAVFLLKVAHQLESFYPKEPFYAHSIENLKTLLNRSHLNEDHKLVVLAELAAELSDKDSLDHEEVKLLLWGSIYLEENLSQSRIPADPQALKQIREALLIHAQQIRSVLEEGNPNHQFLNEIVEILRPNLTEAREWETIETQGGFPIFKTKDDSLALYPLAARLISKEAEVLLPSKIRENPQFRDLFPKIQKAILISDNRFSFFDELGHQTIVAKDDKGVVIDQLQEGKWMRHVPDFTFLDEQENEGTKKIVSKLGSRYITQHYVHWIKREKEPDESYSIFSSDPATGQRKFQIKINPKDNHIEEIVSLDDNLRLGKPSTVFESFEDPSYIHDWYDDKGALTKMELPRFGLTFSLSKEPPNSFACEQFPGFTIVPGAQLRALGAHSHYIVLQNASGQRKVLLPLQELKEPIVKEVLEAKYDIERNLEANQLGPQHFVTFDIGKNGRLSSRSKTANLYLAEVLTATQEYKLAAYYLRKFGNNPISYSDTEKSILSAISGMHEITGDESGNGIALQLYADYLLAKNASKENQPYLSLQMPFLYNRYLNLYGNITLFKLSSDEEIFILKYLSSLNVEQINLMRLEELDPVAAQKINKLDLQGNEDAPTPRFVIPEHSNKITLYNPPEIAPLLTRHFDAMERHFVYYYWLCQTGTIQEKEQLRAALKFVRTAEKGKHANMARFFELLLDNPGRFPVVPSLSVGKIDYFKYNDWKKEVQSIFDGMLKQLPPKEKTPPIPLKNFYLGVESQVSAPIPIDLKPYKLEKLSDQCKQAFQENDSFQRPNGSGLHELFANLSTADPVQAREVERLSDDLQAYRNEAAPKAYNLLPDKLEEVRNVLNQAKQEDTKELNLLEESLLRLANQKMGDPKHAAVEQLKKWGQLRKKITLDELIISYARNDFSGYLERNPALTKENLQEMANLVHQYLLRATRLQQGMRAEEVIAKLKNCSPEAQNDLENQLAAQLLTPRSFNPEKDPVYLVFEYMTNLSLRDAQVEKLEEFLKGESVNPVMEMIMGSGKSKVLLPLLGLLRADGKKLSMVVVPSPLFENVAQDTHTILQGFSQNLSSLHFDRNTTFTKESLESIYDQLVAVRNRRDCLIMTSKSIQCLINKFVEANVNFFQSKHVPEDLSIELKWLQKIVNFLKENGDPIFDEADTLFNILHEVSFSLGDSEPPKMHELELLSGLYQLLFTDPELKSLAKLESDPEPQAEAQVLTEELYREQIKQPLAKKAIELLKSLSFDSESLREKAHTYFGSLTTDQKETLIHYLCRSKEHIKEAQTYFDQLDPEIQNIIAFAGEQISSLLPHTLTRNCEEKYGLDSSSNSLFAIPYSASQTPSFGSQFANSYVTLNYTVQTYVKKGVPTQAIESVIHLLQEKALKEKEDKGNKLMPTAETEAGKEFTKLTGGKSISLFSYTPEELQEIVDYTNASLKNKFFFITYYILPRLQQPPLKISCNPHNLVSFFKKASGFTGTLWNAKSMHHSLSAQPALGTDAKTLAVLWENSQDNALTIQEGSLQDMLQQLAKQGASFDMISDAGGYFKQSDNSTMAAQIAQNQNQPIVFYNAKGEQTIVQDGIETPLAWSPLSPEERLTFLDQSHTTGADVPQKWNAVSLVTISRNMLLRDLLQSVWRLRGLEKSQRVRFVLNEEVATIIRQKLHLKNDAPIQLKEILQFTIINQAAQQGSDNYKALKAGLSNIFQKLLLDVLMNEELDVFERTNAVNCLYYDWIKPNAQNAKDAYGQLPKQDSAEAVLLQEVTSAKEKINNAFRMLSFLGKANITKEQCLQEVDAIAEKIKPYLPETLTQHELTDEGDQTIEIEQELKNETEREVQLESNEEQENERPKLYLIQPSNPDFEECDSFEKALQYVMQKGKEKETSVEARILHEIVVDKLPIFPLASFFSSDSISKAYASAFKKIDITMNVPAWKINKSFQFFGPNRTEIHHLLVKEDKVIVLTQYEARNYLNDPDYYNLTLGFNDPERKPSPEAQLRILKIKFLNGEVQYSRDELEMLEGWLGNKRKMMKKLFEETILKGYPNKKFRYRNSALRTLLKNSR